MCLEYFTLPGTAGTGINGENRIMSQLVFPRNGENTVELIYDRCKEVKFVRYINGKMWPWCRFEVKSRFGERAECHRRR